MDFNLVKKYRHLERYREIVQVLIKNGLGFLVGKLELDRFLSLSERFTKKEQDLDLKKEPGIIRKVLQELGPTYIKLGQVLSTRADIIPPAYIKELRKLQDRVPAFPFKQVEDILRAELGDYSEIFREINRKPEAAASIAQIHSATLVNGSEIILKVQRPEIKRKIEIDLDILYHLASLAEGKGFLPEFIDLPGLIEEFGRAIKRELDFQQEIASVERFRDNFRDNPNILVPEVYKDISTRRLIVMEEIKGVKLNQLTEEDLAELDREFLASLGAEAFLKQVLIDGFFHADPHPGNIFVVESNKLAYIDFGMMGQLTAEDQDLLSLLFLALLKKDINIIVDLVLEIGSVKGSINKRRFKLGIKNLIDRFYGVKLNQIDFKGAVDEFQKFMYDHQLVLPSEFFLLGRAIAISEGVGFMLDPSFSPVDVGARFSRELVIDLANPGKILGRFLDRLWDLRVASKGMPAKFNLILDKLVEDDFSINFKHLNLGRLINKIDIISNRLSISLIISALIIGSSMILQTDMQPLIFGIPVLGFIGYIIAGILGLSLVIAIFRSGRF